MPPPLATLLEPRKSPIQARSTASVDAILEATLQVLVADGKERLTTTRVAARAGVSVGTLYQYFPNKSSLLQAVLRRHMEDVASAVERVCLEERGQPLAHMASALVDAFLRAKMRGNRERDNQESVAMYAVSSDIDGVRIVQQMSDRLHRAILTLLTSSPETLTRDPALVVLMLQGAMAGVTRRLLESPDPARLYKPLRQELILLAQSYLIACTGAAPCISPI